MFLKRLDLNTYVMTFPITTQKIIENELDEIILEAFYVFNYLGDNEMRF